MAASDGRIFYPSLYEALKNVDDPETYRETMDAIMAYAFYGEEPEELSPIAKMLFTMAKPSFESNNAKREAGKKGAEARWSDKNSTSDSANSKNNSKNSSAISAINPANATDTETDTDTVTVTETDTDTGTDTETGTEEKQERESRSARPAPPYQQIVDAYNQTCVSYPAVRSLSDTRKKAIRARLKTYSLGDFQTMFEKAEKSDFLKGENQRNWSADFDWMLKDANFAKILDGNYDNDKGKAHLPRGDDKFSAIRQWAESKGVKMD